MDANASIDTLVTTVCVPLAALASALLVGSVTVATLEAVLVRCTGGGAWRWSPAPRAVRRIVFAACGVAVAVALPTTVHADPDQAARRSCPPLCLPGLDGLRLPDLPVTGHRGDDGAHRPQRSGPPETVLVRPGDCLWRLASELIGTGSPDTDVARTMQALYRANRAAIGPDPDLIFPGTRLKTPEVLR